MSEICRKTASESTTNDAIAAESDKSDKIILKHATKTTKTV
jgi:hypothetical protein